MRRNNMGNVFRLIRIANNNMTVTDAAKQLEVSSSYLCDIESGRKNVSLKILNKFSSFYNIPVSQILLIDEAQIEDNLDYKQTLKLILEYYILIEDKNQTKTNDNRVKKLLQ